VYRPSAAQLDSQYSSSCHRCASSTIEVFLCRSLLSEGGGCSCGRLWCCSCRVFLCVTCLSSYHYSAWRFPPPPPPPPFSGGGGAGERGAVRHDSLYSSSYHRSASHATHQGLSYGLTRTLAPGLTRNGVSLGLTP